MYQQGDIISVYFPFSDDIKKSKLRPAVVVSNKTSNDLDSDVLICPITSTIRESEFSYLINDIDLSIPLPKNSEIRCNKIATIRSSLIINKISTINKSALNSVLTKIKSVFTSLSDAV